MLTLINTEGGYHPVMSKNPDFSTTKHLINLRLICKLELVRCGSVEEKQNALSILFLTWRSNEV